MADPLPDREVYIADWCKQLKIENSVWALTVHLVTAKNYATAVSLMLELSWRVHRDYLNRAEKALEEWHRQSKYCAVSATDLYNFADYYTKNIEAIPT